MNCFMRGLLSSSVIRNSVQFVSAMGTLTIRQFIDAEKVLSKNSQILIVGKKKCLRQVNFDKELSKKFAGIVNRGTWEQVIDSLSPKGSNSIPLHLNLARVIAVDDDSSRHNAPSNCVSIFKEMKKVCRPEGVKTVAIVLFASSEDVFPSVAAISRCFPLFSRTTKMNTVPEIIQVEVVLSGGKMLTERDCLFLQTLAESIRTVGRLVDAPSNELNTEEFADEAIRLTSRLDGVESVIIKGEELLAKGFGGIYHVGKASNSPPIFACFSSKPSGATKTCALVGKGIVYDTGGMQLKPKTAMPGMKNDMGGAAALLASFYLLVKLGFKQNLHCLLCIADNNISPTANRPDDIITMLSGKTVEIVNTDAEGRLVLADGVYYATNVLKADTVIDMATLTGAQGQATGKLHAAVMTNREDWEHRACVAGRVSGDLVHPIPFCPDLYSADLQSPVADLKNSNFGKPTGSPSSIAGLFIGAHIDYGNDINWIHFDIAYPVGYCDRATGFGPALIAALLSSDLNVPLLNAV